jgi:hypothetical protein
MEQTTELTTVTVMPIILGTKLSNYVYLTVQY